MFRLYAEGHRLGARKLHWLHSAVFLLAALTLVGGCDDIHRPPSEVADFEAAYDPDAATLEFSLESSAGAVSEVRLIASDVRFEPQSGLVHAMVALRNVGQEPLPGPVGVWVHGFVPESVVPSNAECLRIPEDPTPVPGGCLFRHEGTYGDDNVLSPGETSTPLEWMLHNPESESFGFRARLQLQPEPSQGDISGVVFHDLNENGQRENNEPGIGGAIVTLKTDDIRVETRTAVDGRYGFLVRGPGLYEVDKVSLESWQVTTPHPLQVLILRRPDGTLSNFDRADFGCTRLGPSLGVPVQGIVYNDLNRNGQHDLGEPGLPDVLVEGATPQCPTFAPIRVRTDRRGRYLMRLPECEPPFVVGREPLRGFVDTSPNPIFFLEPAPGDSAVLRADFGAARADSTCRGSEARLIEILQKAYELRDLSVFVELLSRDPGAEFLYVLNEPSAAGETHWGAPEERRIHRRMFEPENLIPGEPPVPDTLWPNSIDVALTQETEFSERPDLYRSPDNPEGLDPQRWRARDARYGYEVFLDTRGDLDFLAVGQSNFVVIEDLHGARCSPGSFLLYRWQDLGSATQPVAALLTATARNAVSVEERSWSQIKTLYR